MADMVNHMMYSGDGLKVTESFEGLRLEAYRDTGGIWTCGYGHTIGVGPSTVCTPELAQEWLIYDIAIAVKAVNRLVTVALTQGEFDALVDFTFNVGSGNLAKSTLLDLLNKGDYASAAKQFEQWDKCGGQVVAGLLRRRQAEEGEFTCSTK